jgi:hypothetical protein
MSVLDHLLRAPPSYEPAGDIDAWLVRLATCPFERPIDRALWAGFEADRLGYAFAGAYQAALSLLFAWAADASSAPAYAWPAASTRLSFAATESGGAHPRAIETTLTEEPGGALVLDGTKTFATMASAADELLVVASRGAGPDERKRLCVIRVRANATGLVIEARPPTAFAPEIPHAKVILTSVAVREEDVLPGDGYSTYLKPFRTIEDTHVLAASLGHVLGAARVHAFDSAVTEGALALVLALLDLTDRPPLDPACHVALAGLFATARRLIAEHDKEWDKADASTRDRFRRDLALLVVAETARQARTAAAWKALSSVPDRRR